MSPSLIVLIVVCLFAEASAATLEVKRRRELAAAAVGGAAPSLLTHVASIAFTMTGKLLLGAGLAQCFIQGEYIAGVCLSVVTVFSFLRIPIGDYLQRAAAERAAQAMFTIPD